MTKRDKQASEYAAESYEKTPAERGVSNTFDLITDANDFLLYMATRRVARTHYEGCRTDHVECLVAALVREIALLRTPAMHTTPSECSVRGEGTVGERLVGRLSITQAMLADNERLRAEIDQLREAIRRLAEQDATLSVCEGNVTVTMDATLTDEEREAVETAVRWLEPYPQVASTLRNLLERLQ